MKLVCIQRGRYVNPAKVTTVHLAEWTPSDFRVFVDVVESDGGFISDAFATRKEAEQFMHALINRINAGLNAEELE